MLTRRNFLRQTVGLGVIGLGGYSTIVEPNFRLAFPHWPVEHSSWPAAMPPLKIAILTDIHVVEPWMQVTRLKEIVEAANALEPDITVLLGDYVCGIRKLRMGIVPIPQWTRVLGKLHAKLGVYAVLGNHDWWDDPVGVRDGFRAAGVPVLENKAVKINRNGYRFWIAGLGDQIAYPLGHRKFRGADDLDGTIKQTSGDADPVILLAHEPDIFVRVPDRVALTLSGHTHGGQVYVPFIGNPLVPSAYRQRFAYGHIIEHGRHLVVSGGLGMTGIPVRFMVPPEVTVVTLAAPGNAPVV